MSGGLAPPQPCSLQGLPCVAVALPEGDRAVVALQGAQLLSWVPGDGVERLYLSPHAAADGRTAIRGGVPLCFPQFNQRGPLPKHGFARNLTWALLEHGPAPGTARFVLQDNAASRALWPHAFRAVLDVLLAPGSLTIRFEVENRGEATLDFALALHTYLRTGDIAATRLHGLGGAAFWDAVHDARRPADAAFALAFDGEIDRVYAAPGAPLRLEEPRGALHISQSPTLTETVVWNPGPALCARLGDMPPDGWKHMLCVETARIDAPVTLAAGASWSGWQRLSVAS